MSKELSIQDVVLVKHSNGSDYLSWSYKGQEFWAQGEFFIDRNGFLHHTFITPDTEEEIEITIKYITSNL